MDTINIGENLRIQREKKRLSQTDLAFLVDISQSTYNRIETNEKMPDLPLLYKLANALDVPVALLLAQPDAPPPPPPLTLMEKIKELANTPLGIFIAILLTVPVTNACYDIGYSFFRSWEISETFKNNAGMITGSIGFIYIIYWMIKLRKKDKEVPPADGGDLKEEDSVKH